MRPSASPWQYAANPNGDIQEMKHSGGSNSTSRPRSSTSHLLSPAASCNLLAAYHGGPTTQYATSPSLPMESQGASRNVHRSAGEGEDVVPEQKQEPISSMGEGDGDDSSCRRTRSYSPQKQQQHQPYQLLPAQQSQQQQQHTAKQQLSQPHHSSLNHQDSQHGHKYQQQMQEDGLSNAKRSGSAQSGYHGSTDSTPMAAGAAGSGPGLMRDKCKSEDVYSGSSVAAARASSTSPSRTPVELSSRPEKPYQDGYGNESEQEGRQRYGSGNRWDGSVTATSRKSLSSEGHGSNSGSSMAAARGESSSSSRTPVKSSSTSGEIRNNGSSNGEQQRGECDREGGCGGDHQGPLKEGYQSSSVADARTQNRRSAGSPMKSSPRHRQAQQSGFKQGSKQDAEEVAGKDERGAAALARFLTAASGGFNLSDPEGSYGSASEESDPWRQLFNDGEEEDAAKNAMLYTTSLALDSVDVSFNPSLQTSLNASRVPSYSAAAMSAAAAAAVAASGSPFALLQAPVAAAAGSGRSAVPSAGPLVSGHHAVAIPASAAAAAAAVVARGYQTAPVSAAAAAGYSSGAMEKDWGDEAIARRAWREVVNSGQTASTHMGVALINYFGARGSDPRDSRERVQTLEKRDVSGTTMQMEEDREVWDEQQADREGNEGRSLEQQTAGKRGGESGWDGRGADKREVGAESREGQEGRWSPGNSAAAGRSFGKSEGVVVQSKEMSGKLSSQSSLQMQDSNGLLNRTSSRTPTQTGSARKKWKQDGFMRWHASTEEGQMGWVQEEDTDEEEEGEEEEEGGSTMQGDGQMQWHRQHEQQQREGADRHSSTGQRGKRKEEQQLEQEEDENGEEGEGEWEEDGEQEEGYYSIEPLADEVVFNGGSPSSQPPWWEQQQQLLMLQKKAVRGGSSWGGEVGMVVASSRPSVSYQSAEEEFATSSDGESHGTQHQSQQQRYYVNGRRVSSPSCKRPPDDSAGTVGREQSNCGSPMKGQGSSRLYHQGVAPKQWEQTSASEGDRGLADRGLANHPPMTVAVSRSRQSHSSESGSPKWRQQQQQEVKGLRGVLGSPRCSPKGSPRVGGAWGRSAGSVLSPGSSPRAAAAAIRAAAMAWSSQQKLQQQQQLAGTRSPLSRKSFAGAPAGADGEGDGGEGLGPVGAYGHGGMQLSDDMGSKVDALNPSRSQAASATAGPLSTLSSTSDVTGEPRESLSMASISVAAATAAASEAGEASCDEGDSDGYVGGNQHRRNDGFYSEGENAAFGVASSSKGTAAAAGGGGVREGLSGRQQQQVAGEDRSPRRQWSTGAAALCGDADDRHAGELGRSHSMGHTAPAGAATSSRRAAASASGTSSLARVARAAHSLSGSQGSEVYRYHHHQQQQQENSPRAAATPTAVGAVPARRTSGSQGFEVYRHHQQQQQQQEKWPRNATPTAVGALPAHRTSGSQDSEVYRHHHQQQQQQQQQEKSPNTATPMAVGAVPTHRTSGSQVCEVYHHQQQQQQQEKLPRTATPTAVGAVPGGYSPGRSWDVEGLQSPHQQQQERSPRTVAAAAVVGVASADTMGVIGEHDPGVGWDTDGSQQQQYPSSRAAAAAGGNGVNGAGRGGSWAAEGHQYQADWEQQHQQQLLQQSAGGPVGDADGLYGSDGGADGDASGSTGYQWFMRQSSSAAAAAAAGVWTNGARMARDTSLGGDLPDIPHAAMVGINAIAYILAYNAAEQPYRPRTSIPGSVATPIKKGPGFESIESWLEQHKQHLEEGVAQEEGEGAGGGDTEESEEEGAEDDEPGVKKKNGWWTRWRVSSKGVSAAGKAPSRSRGVTSAGGGGAGGGGSLVAALGGKKQVVGPAAVFGAAFEATGFCEEVVSMHVLQSAESGGEARRAEAPAAYGAVAAAAAAATGKQVAGGGRSMDESGDFNRMAASATAVSPRELRYGSPARLAAEEKAGVWLSPKGSQVTLEQSRRGSSLAERVTSPSPPLSPPSAAVVESIRALDRLLSTALDSETLISTLDSVVEAHAPAVKISIANSVLSMLQHRKLKIVEPATAAIVRLAKGGAAGVLVEAGVVDMLSELLRSKIAGAPAVAAAALDKLSYSPEVQVAMAGNEQLVSGLVWLMGLKDQQVVAAAASALWGMLASDDAGKRKVARAPGVLPVIIKLLHKSNLKVLEIVLGMIRSMAYDAEVTALLVLREKGAVEGLLHHMSHGDRELVPKVISVVSALAESPGNVPLLLEVSLGPKQGSASSIVVKVLQRELALQQEAVELIGKLLQYRPAAVQLAREPGILKGLLEVLQKGDLVASRAAANCICQLSAVSLDFAAAAAAAPGMLQVFVKGMHGSSRLVIDTALAALQQVVSLGAEMCLEVAVQPGALPRLLQLVDEAEEDVLMDKSQHRGRAATAAAAVDGGAGSPSGSPKGKRADSFQTRAFAVLSVLALHPESSLQVISEPGSLMSLMAVVWDEDESVAQMGAVVVLSLLVQDNDTVRDAAAAADSTIVPGLVKLLDFKHRGVLLEAVKALQNLCYPSGEMRSALVEAGGVTRLLELMWHADGLVSGSAAQVLLLLADDTVSALMLCTQPGVLSTVMQLLTAPDLKVLKAGAQLIIQLCACTPAAVRAITGETACLATLLQQLMVGGAGVVVGGSSSGDGSSSSVLDSSSSTASSSKKLGGTNGRAYAQRTIAGILQRLSFDAGCALQLCQEHGAIVALLRVLGQGTSKKLTKQVAVTISNLADEQQQQVFMEDLKGLLRSGSLSADLNKLVPVIAAYGDDVIVIRAVVWLLELAGQLGNEEVYQGALDAGLVAALMQLLSHRHLSVLTAAVALFARLAQFHNPALLMCQQEGLLDGLIEMMGHEEEEVAAAALQTFRALGKKFEDVRQLAAGQPGVIEGLCAQLNHKSSAVVCGAAAALGNFSFKNPLMLQSSETIGQLVSLLGHRRPKVVAAVLGLVHNLIQDAGAALKFCKHQEAIGSLAELLMSQDDGEVVKAVVMIVFRLARGSKTALIVCGRPRVLAALVQVLWIKDTEVRQRVGMEAGVGSLQLRPGRWGGLQRR